MKTRDQDQCFFFVTMQMFEKGSIWSIFEDHHPIKRLIFFTVSNQIHKVLMVDPRKCINLHKDHILYNNSSSKMIFFNLIFFFISVTNLSTVSHFHGSSPFFRFTNRGRSHSYLNTTRQSSFIHSVTIKRLDDVAEILTRCF